MNHLAEYRFPTAPLGYVADVRSSGVDKKISEGETPVKLCNYTDIYYNSVISEQIDFMVATASFSEISRLTIRHGDVLITKDSETADDIGIPALVAENLNGVVLGYHCSLIRPDSNVLDPSFLYWVLHGRPAKSFFETRARGVTRVGLRLDDIMSLPIPVPDVEIQREIVNVLETENGRFRRLVGNTPDSVLKAGNGLISDFLQLIRVRREALVTLSVTGQLEIGGLHARST